MKGEIKRMDVVYIVHNKLSAYEPYLRVGIDDQAAEISTLPISDAIKIQEDVDIMIFSDKRHAVEAFARKLLEAKLLASLDILVSKNNLDVTSTAFILEIAGGTSPGKQKDRTKMVVSADIYVELDE